MASLKHDDEHEDLNLQSRETITEAEILAILSGGRWSRFVRVTSRFLRAMASLFF